MMKANEFKKSIPKIRITASKKLLEKQKKEDLKMNLIKSGKYKSIKPSKGGFRDSIMALEIAKTTKGYAAYWHIFHNKHFTKFEKQLIDLLRDMTIRTNQFMILNKKHNEIIFKIKIVKGKKK